MSSAPMEPQVPGPGLPKPAPKKVATVHAQKVRLPPGLLAGLVFIGVATGTIGDVVEVFEHVRIQNGRTDFVDACGPLAEIDLAAAVGAEREVLVIRLHEHGACGAA